MNPKQVHWMFRSLPTLTVFKIGTKFYVFCSSLGVASVVHMTHHTLLSTNLAIALVAGIHGARSQPLFAADTLDILIVAGQSNAVGADTDPGQLPADEIDTSIRFLFRTGDPPPDAHDSTSAADAWAVLGPQPRGNPAPRDQPRQWGNFSHPAGGFGPEISFARKLAHRASDTTQTKTALAVVKVALSGTSVADDWDPLGQNERGACYRALLDEVREAKSLAEKQGFNVRLRALLWIQGESDATPTDAPHYASRLQKMLQSLRADLHAERLPILLGVNVHFHQGRNQQMRTIISAQKQISRELSGCRYVDTSGASLANANHFDSLGTIDVGNRAAISLLAMERGSSDPMVWKRHVVYEGASCLTAVAADYTGDGLSDIVCNTGKQTLLLVAPEWRQLPIGEPNQHWIHSETMDVDGDGDPDVIGTPYSPGRIVWLECPGNPQTDRWVERLIDEQVNGVHGLLIGDVDGKGSLDLLATSAQPKPPFPHSLVWYRVPERPLEAPIWERFVFAAGDAPGLTHYLGIGDIDGDGLADAATGAKGDETDAGAHGQWFAWWKQGVEPTIAWTKELVSASQPGATNIHPADVNGDGKTDLIASRGHGQGVIWFERQVDQAATTVNWIEHPIDESIREPHCLAAVDLDRDGDVDVATVAFGSERAVWYENDGHGEFTTHVIGENQQAYDLRVTDLDSDGDLDLVVAGRASNNVVWYENPW